MANDRFDLEQAIMNCWHTTDDLDLLAEAVLDGELEVDAISNALMGIRELHNLRAKKVFEVFEFLVKDGELE